MVQTDGNNKSLKMLPKLVPSGCMPMPWGYIYMFEIVKKCKISLPAQDQLSGERYRTVGPLVAKFAFYDSISSLQFSLTEVCS